MRVAVAAKAKLDKPMVGVADPTMAAVARNSRRCMERSLVRSGL
jgi:hypothetical protein